MDRCVSVCALIFPQLTKKPYISYTREQFNDKTINIFSYFPFHLLIHNTEMEEKKSASGRFWEKQQNLREIADSNTGTNKKKPVSSAD